MNAKDQMIQQLVKKNTENASKEFPCITLCMRLCLRACIVND